MSPFFPVLKRKIRPEGEKLGGSEHQTSFILFIFAKRIVSAKQKTSKLGI